MLEKRFHLVLQTAICAAVLLLSANVYAIDWKSLEEKAKKYTEDGKIDTSNLNHPDQNKSVNLEIPGQPTGRIIDNSDKMLSEKDIRHITVHMKLANRHFLRKNYSKAIDELESVFERKPDHSGGRFMRAVIAARKKDYLTAWQNILVAQEKDPNNAKIKSFIEKLSTKLAKPDKFVGVPGIYRPVPVSACEKAADVIEKFLKSMPSQYLTFFSTEELVSEGSDATMIMNMVFSAPPDEEKILAVFKEATGEPAIRIDDKKDTKKLSVKFKLANLPIGNPSVKAVSELREFVKMIAEEADVALMDTIERDKENKVLETTYEISARNFSSLNDFLRKASPYAHTYRVIELRLAYIKGSQNIIWKGKVRIDYQLE
ncbi:MAG: hypothetical protein Kow0029_28000 [Candidatus Rifleibacteriota bacterium]